jgi:hypothetical protein
VGLWIDLNRHLSGVDCVELVEAMSFEQGQILAQIERPRIVVYGADNSDGPGRAPEQLLGQLRERGLLDTQVIAVVSGQDGTHGRDPRPESSDSSDAIVCTADELLDRVSGLLDLATGPQKPKVELLAHYEVDGGASRSPRSGFAVLLELSERRLLFETDLCLEQATEMHLNFFLHDPDSDAQRSNVSLSCVIGQCRDEAKMIYSARVSKIGDDARQAIQRYTASPIGGVGGR